MQADDTQWRQPDSADPPAGPAQPSWSAPTPPPTAPPSGPATAPQSMGTGTGYQGPPPMTPPPAGWRTPSINQPPPPRPLPPQDHARIDDEEARARAVTLGIALVAGMLMLILICTVCGRLLL